MKKTDAMITKYGQHDIIYGPVILVPYAEMLNMHIKIDSMINQLRVNALNTPQKLVIDRVAADLEELRAFFSYETPVEDDDTDT